jgi:hypothetical protein
MDVEWNAAERCTAAWGGGLSRRIRASVRPRLLDHSIN